MQQSLFYIGWLWHTSKDPFLKYLSIMQYITFNPDYVLKPDDGRALVMAALVGRNSQKGITDSFTNVIHPIYAMILSFIDGRERNECISEAATELDVPPELIEKFIDSVTNNPEQIYLKSKDGVSAFPPNTIVVSENHRESHRYSPNIFAYEEVKLEMKRHLTPSTITLMVNNICVTDCIYCYQDKSRKVGCAIPLNRILELIHEAHSLRVNTFDVIGGEFFLYKYWREVLGELRKYGYNPYLSTKMPLSEEDVKYLAELNVHDLQLSIDSLIEDHLKPSLKIKDGYVERLKKSLSFLERYGVPIMVHTVLTKYNDSVEDMMSIYDVIKGLKNLVDWHIVKGDPTLYPKVDYSEIEISQDKMNSLSEILETLSHKDGIIIHYPPKSPSIESSSLNSSIAKGPVRFETFFNRSFCSGLYSSLYILPDGNVTMCEQLYWNKKFLVGNIQNQSIEEVWNSDKAKSIYFIKQSDIPEDSLCHSCAVFKECRTVRQVCYRDIIRKYGKEKWYYPDVNCPYAAN